jgi:hypothetical protein
MTRLSNGWSGVSYGKALIVADHFLETELDKLRASQK